MKAVVLGCSGQLGQELVRQLPGAIGLHRGDVDVTDPVRLREILIAQQPTIVFNATSNNKVDAAEADSHAVFAVNALAVRNLAAICRDLGCGLVHFTTNYVFGGDRSRRTPYTEEDLIAPINAYGVSKAIGEHLALLTWPRTLIVRTAALFGRCPTSRHNFLDNMLAKAKAGETVRIVNDQVVAPTRTVDLAAGAIHLTSVGATGVYHLNGPDAATWYELAREYLSLAGFEKSVHPATTAEIGAPARRPEFSVLAIEKFLRQGFTPPMPWRDAVRWYWGIGRD